MPRRDLKRGPWEATEEPRVFVRTLSSAGRLTGGVVGYQPGVVRVRKPRAIGGPAFATRASAIQAARNLLDGAEPVAPLALPGVV